MAGGSRGADKNRPSNTKAQEKKKLTSYTSLFLAEIEGGSHPSHPSHPVGLGHLVPASVEDDGTCLHKKPESLVGLGALLAGDVG